MKAILYRLRLLEPVLVAQAGAGEENSAVALSCIPGSAIRGALAARWLAGHPNADLAVDSRARPWFIDGTVCYLNAYPDYDGERTLPLPASWFVEKDRADDTSAVIYDLAVEPDSKLGVLKAPSGGPFCRLERGDTRGGLATDQLLARQVGAERFDQVHITLDDVNRRGEGNQVYRYEALAAGQLFAGAIIAPDETELTQLKTLLESGDLFLGRAHLAGYGHVVIESCIVKESWREVAEHGVFDGARVVVTLLSDAIVRGAEGQVGWDGGRALAAALGCSDGSKPLAAFGSTVLVGGYNRRWSLPLLQAEALAAGSVLVFARQDTDLDALQVALDHGVGERRAEGFGRIAINWQVSDKIHRRSELPINIATPKLSLESKKMARMMVQRRLRLELDRALAQKVDFNFGQLRSPLPENAQLSAIRQAVTPGLTGDDLSRLIVHLSSLKQTGRTQLERCGMGNDTLYHWLLERSRRLDVKEQLLGDAPALPSMAGEVAALDETLCREYTARLIDGVMRLSARRREEVKR